ncbi:MAG: HAD-IA family hydrolase [Chloroflexi bacterium]|nr:HAD-IA family hydrolase [Chloroflexota bacterium]
MIKCVFFDFDGVLRNWEYDQESLDAVFGIPIDVFREVAFAPENVVPAVRGEITDEEWRANVGRILKTRFPGRDVEGALEFWSGRTGELAIEVLEIVRECKSKLPVALMTNATSKLNQDLESLGIANLFDHVINASEVGSVKPESEIYLYALKLVGIEPHEAFFTDDMPENVEMAAQLGYVGHVFETPEGLRTALTKAGVL